MEGMNYKAAKELGQKYDAGLKATHLGFRKCVTVCCDDGSFFHWDSAFLMQIAIAGTHGKETWIYVFTEHHGFHLFEKSDLLSYVQYDPHDQDVEVLPVT